MHVVWKLCDSDLHALGLTCYLAVREKFRKGIFRLLDLQKDILKVIWYDTMKILEDSDDRRSCNNGETLMKQHFYGKHSKVFKAVKVFDTKSL